LYEFKPYIFDWHYTFDVAIHLAIRLIDISILSYEEANLNRY